MSARGNFSLSDLEPWSRAFGIALDPAALKRMQAYLDLLLLWNRRVALVSQTKTAEILSKHFADSLVVASKCVPGDRIVDLGSGAGFPGLVVALVRADVRVVMIESNRRKASFLQEALRVTETTNGSVVNDRFEAVAQHPEHRAGYSLVTARALADVPTFLALARPFSHPNSRAIAMKGPRYAEEIRDLAVSLPDFTLSDVVSYTLPDGAQRVLLCFCFAPTDADVSRETKGGAV